MLAPGDKIDIILQDFCDSMAQGTLGTLSRHLSHSSLHVTVGIAANAAIKDCANLPHSSPQFTQLKILLACIHIAGHSEGSPLHLSPISLTNASHFHPANE